MQIIMLFIGIAFVLFGLAFFTKRRFGVLGLALAAGSLLSSLWAAPLVKIIEDSTNFSGVSLAGYVAAGLVLAPAVLLLFSGPSYKGKHGRFMGALLFTLFALILVAQPLGMSLVVSGPGRALYEFLQANQMYIITAGVVAAVLDLLAVHASGGHSSKSKH
jgi:hypothetical protein